MLRSPGSHNSFTLYPCPCASTGTPPRTSCATYGDGLTTLGLRSISKKLCGERCYYSLPVLTLLSYAVCMLCRLFAAGKKHKPQQQPALPCLSPLLLLLHSQHAGVRIQP